ncbi:MAG: FtsQ-type POTRA domain-containing protein [Nitrospinae bacterium]|nr:FtsQ-type POTRA domain-containing protein [Nitrospinota bacterium]
MTGEQNTPNGKMTGSAGKGRKKAARVVVWAALKTMAALAAVAIMAFGANTGYEAAVKNRYFDVSQIRVEGLSVIHEEEIKKLAGPVEGRNTLSLDMREISKRLLAHPWVGEVELRRELPSTLGVRIKERVPAFVARAGKEFWVVDDGGVLICPAENPAEILLPIIEGAPVEDGKVTAGAKLSQQDFKAAVYAWERLSGYRFLGKHQVMGFDLAEPGKIKIRIKDSQTSLTFPRRKWEDEVERLITVDHILRTKEGTPLSLSMMFADKVIVTYPSPRSAGNGSRG